MKILMLTIDYPPNSMGGEGIVAEKIAHLLNSKGLNIEVVAPLKKDCFNYDKNNSIKIHRVKIYGKTFLTKIPSFIFSTRNIVKKFDGDIIYTLRPCMTNKKVKTILNMHITRYSALIGCLKSKEYLSALLNFFYIPFDIWMISKSNKIIVLSKKMRDEILLFSKNDTSKKIFIIENGIDLKLFKPRIKNFTSKKLLYIGRLDCSKGIFTLLNAFNNIIKKKNLHLSIAGEGPIKKEILKFIKKNNLKKNVSLLNKVPFENTPSIYQSHDLTILPSSHESFGMVILESIACGTPVISSDVCVDLGQPMFKPGQTKELEYLISQILFDTEKLKLLSTSGLKKIKNYDWDSIIQKFIDTFNMP